MFERLVICRIAYFIFKIDPLGNHAKDLLRRTMWCVEVGLPLADSLLVYFKLIGHFALSQAHILEAKLPYCMLRRIIHLRATHAGRREDLRDVVANDI